MQLVPYFGGEQIPCLMYSSKWNLREKGAQEFTQEMEKAFEISRSLKIEPNEKDEQQPHGQTHEQKCNKAIIQNMNEVLKDKVQQIVNKSILMVEKYQAIVANQKQINPKQDTSMFEKFLMNFLEKLADQKVSQKIQNAYKNFYLLP